MNDTLFEMAKNRVGWDTLKEPIPYFQIDNVLDRVFDLGNIRTFNWPNISPPFEKFAMGYRIPGADEYDRKMPILVTSFGNEDVVILVNAERIPDYGNIWEMRILAFYGSAQPVGQIHMFLNDKGIPTNVEGDTGEIAANPVLRIYPDILKEAANLAGSITFPALYACGLLNCKNVKSEYVEPTGRSHKRRARKARNTYKVLKIKVGGSRKVYDPGNKTGKKNREHICRGGIKTYTDEAPLFGKIVGQIYVPQHTRGSREKGIIVKDYKLG